MIYGGAAGGGGGSSLTPPGGTLGLAIGPSQLTLSYDLPPPAPTAPAAAPPPPAAVPPPLASAPAIPTCEGKRATIVARAGRTNVSGTPRADVIVGSDAAETINAGAGNDLLDERGAGGHGHDRLLGGTGDDRLWTAGAVKDSVDCGPGRDSTIVDVCDRPRHRERVHRHRPPKR